MKRTRDTKPEGAKKSALSRSVHHPSDSMSTAQIDVDAGPALRAVGEIASIGIFLMDVAGRVTYFNSVIGELLGVTLDDADTWPDRLYVDDRDRVLREWAECLATASVFRSCHRFVKKDAEIVWAEVVASPIVDAAGNVTGMAGTLTDVTNQLQSAAVHKGLVESDQRYHQMLETAQEGVWLRDENARTTFVNRRMTEMLGYTAEEMMGRPVYDFMDADARAEAERRFARRQKGQSQQHDVRYKHKDGSDVWTIVSASPIYNDDGAFAGVFGMITDITERKQQEEMVWRQAYHDNLTGLPNRSLFEDRLNQLIRMADRQTGRVGVMFLDLDRFKQINDTLGHKVGDELLKIVAERISSCLRAGDTVARMGGDEFTAILPGIDHPQDTVKVAQKVLEALKQPMRIAGQVLYTAGSIGISIHPDDGADVDTLLDSADIAMYRAKEHGMGYCLFMPSMVTDVYE